MNPAYLGDSYDLVKRFFCAELVSLGYSVTIDPMFTGIWGEAEQQFYRLIGAMPGKAEGSTSKRRALFLDPDTGVNLGGGRQHVSFERLAQEAAKFELVFSFDQSFSRQFKADVAIREKLDRLKTHGRYAMYYDSHARFLFVSRTRSSLTALRTHLISLGLPASRLIESHESAPLV